MERSLTITSQSDIPVVAGLGPCCFFPCFLLLLMVVSLAVEFVVVVVVVSPVVVDATRTGS